MVNFKNVSTRGKLGSAFCVLLVMAIAMILLVGHQLLSIRSAVARNEASERIVRLTHVAEIGLLRVNSQMRGTLLTGDFSLLDTYREGMAQFGTSSAELLRVLDDPAQRALIRSAIAANREWHRRFGDRLIAMARAPGGRARATRVLAEAGAVARVTPITRMVARLRDIEERRAAANRDGERLAVATSLRALAIGGAALLAVAVLMAWLLSRLIATPIETLTGVVDRLARQDFAAVVPPDQSTRGDEVGRIARALDVFRSAGLENQRLALESAALREAREREAAEAARLAQRSADRDRATIRIIGDGLAAIARGDLTFRLADGLSDDAVALRADYDAALAQLGAVLRRARDTVSAVERDANAIAAASGELSDRTVQQATAIGVVGERLTRLNETIRQASDGVRRAAEVARSTREDASRSRDAVAQAVTAMARIDDSSEQIGAITGFVRSIADQTALLALNAQMEAARAGDAGAGFAVVAREVSHLAARLQDATGQIGESLALARSCAVDGVGLVRDVSVRLGAILQDVGEMSTLVDAMATAADRQARDVGDVDDRIHAIASFTERNAAMAGEASAICLTLVDGARDLAGSLARFQVADAAAGGAIPAADSDPSRTA